jgi:exonuclease VII small subunit
MPDSKPSFRSEMERLEEIVRSLEANGTLSTDDVSL